MNETEPTTPKTSRAPRAWIVYTMTALAMLSLVAAFFGDVPSLFRAKQKLPPPEENLAPVDHRIPLPDFTLEERSGAKIAKADLNGKVWIAAFVFTRCTMGCPTISTTMKRLQTELNLAERDDLRLVTFTVDPERDQLEDLKKYAKTFQADDKKWLFLTGTEEQVRPLLKEGFKVTADRKKNGKPGDEFDHTTKLAVIDKQGRICGYFDGKQGEHDTDGTRFTGGLERIQALVDQLVNE